MRLCSLHAWNVDQQQAVEIQRDLARLVERDGRLPDDVRYVAGVDAAYGKGDTRRVFAGVVVIDLETGETVETATSLGRTPFPYVPGLFAFRLGPISGTFRSR